MTLRPLRMQKDGSRFCLWPIRLGWQPGGCSTFFGRHGWQIGSERVPVTDTSSGCMPGSRDVFGQTFHIGALKIKLGPRSREVFCEAAMPGGG